MPIYFTERLPLIKQLSVQSFLQLNPPQKLCILTLALQTVIANPGEAQATAVLLDFSLPRSTPASQAFRSKGEIALSFTPPESVARSSHRQSDKSLTASEVLISDASELASSSLPTLAPQIQALFKGGPDSVVARAVGSAEGTRKPNGDRTWAYHGHQDPGNGHWNLGSFSYQHEASSPADADEKQLRRLQNQTVQLQQLAAQKQLELSITEILNGIDLANQAPLAALDRGYIHRLEEARQLSLTEAEGILHARTWSYWDPDLDQWNAPGLGNQWWSISEDQRRRQGAIAQTLALYFLDQSATTPQ